MEIIWCIHGEVVGLTVEEWRARDGWYILEGDYEDRMADT